MATKKDLLHIYVLRSIYNIVNLCSLDKSARWRPPKSPIIKNVEVNSSFLFLKIEIPFYASNVQKLFAYFQTKTKLHC